VNNLEEVVELDVEIGVIDKVLRQARKKRIHGIFQQGTGTCFLYHEGVHFSLCLSLISKIGTL
jgi:hypothetical protein